MEKLKFRKSLSVLANESNLANHIVANIKESMTSIDLNTLMYDSQFIVDICKCVNANEKKMKYHKVWTIQKKNVVLKVFHLLYDDVVDLSRIETQIDFAEENGLISRKSLIRMSLELLGKIF